MAVHICFLVACILFLIPAPGEAAAQASTGAPDESWVKSDRYRAVLNGEELEIEVWLIEGEDVVFVSAEGELLKRMGIEVFREELEDRSAKVSLGRNGRELEFIENDPAYTVDDEVEKLYRAPFVMMNHLLIPSDEMFEELGFSVLWDNENKTVRIEEGQIAEVVRIVPDRLPEGYLDSVFIYSAPESTEDDMASPDDRKPEEPGIEDEEEHLLEYTYDNTIAFSNIAISGDELGSNYIPTTAITNNFNISFQQRLKLDYMLKGIIRTTETNDPMYNAGQLDKLAISFEKESTSLTFYDIMPKFNYYSLRNYQVQGIDVTRNTEEFSWTTLAGKSPKSLYDSEYTRYIYAHRMHRSKKKGRSMALSSVFTKDTGGNLSSDRFSNRVHSFDYKNKFRKTTKVALDYAHSRNRVDGGMNESGKALLAKVDYRKAKSSVKFKYERVGSNFNSETTFFTADKREISLNYAKKASKRFVYSSGYKTVLLTGEETTTLPLYVSVLPLQRRPKFKLVMTYNHEKARSVAGTRTIDAKKLVFGDIWGSTVVSGTYERKKQKEIGGFVGFRIVRKSKVELPLSEKLLLALQAKDEHRTWGARPLTRFLKAGLSYELDDWSGVYSDISRYYNATSNNRGGLAVGYAQLDIINSTEINFEYRYLNYRDHNDNILKVSYAIFR